MPCNADYLNPNQKEINLSKVLAFLDELETGSLNAHDLSGYRKDVYNTSVESIDERLSNKVPELCSKLQNMSESEVKNLSLELQMWWRDHQEADKVRIEEELNELKRKEDIEKALDKLTDYERGLLGH